jgi:O-antigen/teichoic acid export membrane protein
MSDSQIVKRNSIFSFFSITSRLVANAFVLIFFAWFYGPRLFGQISYAHAAASIFLVFADFGFDVLITTEIARNRDRAEILFNKYLSSKLLLTVGALLAMWAFIFIKQFSYEWALIIFIFSFYMFLTTITNFLFALFKGFEKYEYEAKVSLIMNTFLLVASILLMIIKADIKWICACFAISRIPGLALSFSYLQHIFPRLKIRLNFEDFGRTLKKTLLFGLLLVSLNLFMQVDTIILGIYKTEYEVGIYQAVIRIIMVFLILPQIITNAVIPLLTRLNKEDNSKWEKVGRMYYKGMFYAASFIFLVLFLYPNEIIHLVYKDRFTDSAFVLKIFALTIAIRYMLEAMGVMLTTSQKQKTQMLVAVSVTLFSLLANMIVIPKYSFNGAAIVCLVSNIMMMIGYLFTYRKMILKWMVKKYNIYPVIATIIMYTVFSNIHSLHFISSIIIMLGVYGIIGFFLYLNKEERQMIFQNNNIITLLKSN